MSGILSALPPSNLCEENVFWLCDELERFCCLLKSSFYTVRGISDGQLSSLLLKGNIGLSPGRAALHCMGKYIIGRVSGMFGHLTFEKQVLKGFLPQWLCCVRSARNGACI